MKFGEYLKTRRKELKLSQQTVAEMAGITQGSYSKIETSFFEPGIHSGLRILVALNVKLTNQRVLLLLQTLKDQESQSPHTPRSQE